MKIFRYEFLKIYRNRTTWIIFAALFVLLIVPLILDSGHQHEINELYLYEQNYQMGQDAINNLSKEPAAKEIVHDIKESNTYLKGIIDGIKENDKEKIIHNELKFETKALEDIQTGKQVGVPLVEQKKTVQVLNFLVTNKMDKKVTAPREMGGINYFEMIFSTSNFITVFFLLIAVFIAYFFTLDDRNQNIMIYNMSPYSMLKVYVQKFLSVYLSIILNVSFGFLILFVFLFMKNGFGNSEYPIAVIHSGTEVALLSTSHYLLKILLFMNSWVLYFLFIGLFISFISSNLILNMFVLFFPLLLNQYNILNGTVSDKVKPYLLSNYVNVPQIILGGSEYIPLPSTSLTFSRGIGLLSLLSAIFFLFNLLMIRRKNKNKFSVLS